MTDLSRGITVVLVDDHPAFRVGLRVLLEQVPDIVVAGEVGDGEEALALIEALRPTVAVVDCQLPGLGGPELAAELQRRGASTRVLALSAYQDHVYVRGMLSAGAVGYLLKDEAPDVIVAAVRAASRGEGWFSTQAASALMSDARGPAATEVRLTARERAVLRLLAQARTNKEIAAALCIAERTVEFHITNVLRTLGVESRVQAALWAKDHGLHA